jgi:hypothetical protein
VRSIVVIPLALSLVLSTGSWAAAQSSAPALDDGATAAGITREAAVALVLATDPRFADLPDFEEVRAAGVAEFRTAEAVLVSDWYRVLGPTATELVDMGTVWLRHHGSWLIETSLVEACADPEGDIEFPMPDPCAWRHSWYHLVSPDGSVTLLGDEGDPELVAAGDEAAGALPGISWSSGLVQLNANSMRLVAGDMVFTGWADMTVSGAGRFIDVGSDPGDAAYRSLEVEWMEQGVEQRVNLYLEADETHWWVDEIRTSDGSAEGGWIGYAGPLFKTPVGEPFYGDVHLVSDQGPIRGELAFDGLLLRPRFHLDFGGPDAAVAPATE